MRRLLNISGGTTTLLHFLAGGLALAFGRSFARSCLGTQCRMVGIELRQNLTVVDDSCPLIVEGTLILRLRSLVHQRLVRHVSGDAGFVHFGIGDVAVLLGELHEPWEGLPDDLGLLESHLGGALRRFGVQEVFEATARNNDLPALHEALCDHGRCQNAPVRCDDLDQHLGHQNTTGLGRSCGMLKERSFDARFSAGNGSHQRFFVGMLD